MTRGDSYMWPEGKTCAAVLSFDFDGATPYLWGTRHHASEALGELEQRRFGPRQGAHRILDLLADHNVPASFYIPGAIAENYPEVVARIAEEEHEVALHGYLHERVDELSRTEMEETTFRSMECLQQATGKVPVGYRSPSWEMTRDAFAVIADAGLTYDSSLMGYDHPYWVDGIVEVPVQWMLDDAPFYRYVGRGDTRPPAHPAGVVDAWRLELEAARKFNSLFMLTMHPWITGRPSRLLELEKLIAAYHEEPDIWWTTTQQVAAYHREAHADDFRELPTPGTVR